MEPTQDESSRSASPSGSPDTVAPAAGRADASGDERFSAEERAALARADEDRRSGEPDARRRALDVYRAAASRLDPGDALDGERLLWMLDHLRWSTDFPPDFYRRMSECGATREIRRCGRVRHAQLEGLSRGLAWASGVYREVLREEVPAPDRAEVSAARSLAYAEHSRGGWLEALSAARRSIAAATAVGDVLARAVVRTHRCKTLAALGDRRRFDEAMAEVLCDAGLLRGEDSALVGMAVEEALSECALRERRWSDALNHADRALRLVGPAGAPERSFVSWYEMRRAIALASLGRVAEAQTACAVGSHGYSQNPMCRLQLLVVRLLIAAALEDRGGVAAVAADWLAEVAALDGNMRRQVGDGQIADLTSEVACRAESAGLGIADLQPLWDLVGGAILARIRDVEAETGRAPELDHLHADDVAALLDARSRLDAQHARWLDAVRSTVLRAVAAGEAMPRSLQRSDRRVLLCAWCGRVADDEGRWVPVGYYVPRLPLDAPIVANHGMCETCYAAASRPVHRGPPA